MNEGYLVFENISEQGPIDIIIVNPKNGKATFLDVKTTKPRLHNKSGNQGAKLNLNQKKLGVRLCLVKDEDVWLPRNIQEVKEKRNKKGQFEKQKNKRISIWEED